jgi:pyruvate dehydrogenase E2 component (dihydrolipoamide acetyltransferase)
VAEKVLMIALSPTMETGTVARWRKKEGDTIASGDVICEVETDKATMDYEATAEGTLLKIVLPEGGQARVGDLIAVVGSPGEDIAALLGAAPSPATQVPKPAAKAAAAGPAPAAPAAPAAAPAAASFAAPRPAGQLGAGGAFPGGRLRSSPLARRLADEKGIDLRAVAGTGPAGRIVRRDVDAVPARGGAGAAALPDLPLGPGDELVPLSGMRRVIAQRLSDSMFSAPHFYLTVTVEADELLAFRARLNAGRDRKISFNAILVGLAGRVLARHPRVNSSWSSKGIIRRAAADIGLAVALPDGLVTPVVRDCAGKGIVGIDAELADLVERARSLKLAPSEYEGATFTISNLGSFGIDEFTAIINPPGSAILAVGAARREPVIVTKADGDYVAARQRMRLTLSCDHRVIDGAVGAAFLRELADTLENPALGLT